MPRKNTPFLLTGTPIPAGGEIRQVPRGVLALNVAASTRQSPRPEPPTEVITEKVVAWMASV